MLKANELRIGNKFQDKKGNVLTCYGVTCDEHEHKGIVWYDLELGFYLDLKECFPVKLTESILKDAGFSMCENNYKYWCLLFEDIEHMGICIENGYAFIGQKGGRVKTNSRIKHVHQLQNLYFALTGEELTIIY